MIARRVALTVAAGAAALGVGLHGLGTPTVAPAAGGTAAVADHPRLVLVSGRDDHGYVATDAVPLYDAPEGDRRVATVHDGTLAEVLSTDGEWARVRTVEGGHRVGWVDDFFLRGEVRLVGSAPTCTTTVGGTPREGGTLVVVRALRAGQVRVETLTPPATTGWAPRADVQELPPQGARCGDVPPDDRHAHHRRAGGYVGRHGR